MTTPDRATLDALVMAAREARQHAHAPYSGFRVGAAVAVRSVVFRGANVENASYPLSLCAERAAVAAAVTAGHARIDAVAVATEAPPVVPCGGCLQVLAEFGSPDMPVLSVGEEGEAVVRTLSELLPEPFGGEA